MADLLRAGVGAGALLAGIGVLYNYVVVVPHEQATAAQSVAEQQRIVLIDPKSGTRLVLSGDGFQILDTQGHALASLYEYEGNPALVLTEWKASGSFNDSLRQSVGEPPAPRNVTEGASLNLHPTRVYMRGCARLPCREEYASLDIDGWPELVLKSRLTEERIGRLGLFESNQCSKTDSTCYETNLGLSTRSGLAMATCISGSPLSKANDYKGCESVDIGSMPGPVSTGAHLALWENGKPRLALGSAVLTSPAVGGQEETSLSEITGFDKKGKVIWRMPGQ